MRRARTVTLGLLVSLLSSCGAIAPTAKQATPASAVTISIPDPGLAENAESAPPFSLTASDGTGLVLASVTAETSLEDPLALTELHLVFENPEDRVLEGRFAFTLPEGAAMSRFSMKIDGKWQEAEVVEKQKARVTYEEFLHRKKDPALLEQGAGNEFAVRIFPIPARTKKELIVTYSEVLEKSEPYRLRVAGLPKVGHLHARVHAGGKIVSETEVRDAVPERDLVVASELWANADTTAVRSQHSIVARVRVPAGDAPDAPFESAIVLVDTSASRMLDLGREIAALRNLVRQLPGETKLRVACFDQSIEEVFSGAASDFGEAAVERMRTRRALGASNLSAALAWAGNAAKESQAKHRLVLFTDGVATAGDTTPQELASITKKLGDVGFVRADAVAIGGIRDEAALAAITRGSLASSGVVVGVETGPELIATKLKTATLPTMNVAVEGSKWSWPKSVDVQPGDEVLVYAEATAAKKLRITLGARSFDAPVTKATAPLVDRAVALAKIQEIEASDDGAEARRKEAVELSVKNRVVSRYTTMLVLETDRDYDRFGIDRKAKVDILTIDEGKVTVASQERGFAAQERGFAAAAEKLTGDRLGTGPESARGSMWGNEEPNASLGLSGIGEGGGGRSEGIGLGGVGTIGAGAGTGTGQGFGSGAGRLSGSHRLKPPSVRMGATSVSGRLPPEVVQRIVRQNFGRFRACYEDGLRRKADLAGRVAIKFVIGRDGSVASASVESSTLGAATVEQCVARAFGDLTFPQPEGGVVSVVYPISFAPEGSSEPPPAPMPVARPRPRLPPPAPPAPPVDRFVVTKDPYDGRFAKVMGLLSSGKKDEALQAAWTWRAEAPSDVLAFVALGEAAEARSDTALASRAYGSILELWSYRVDMRRLAGERLERVGGRDATELAADAFEGAIEDRPDHPSSHRLRAMALLKLNRPKEAFEVLDDALGRQYPDGRFRGSLDVLRGDMGIAAAAWLAKDPYQEDHVEQRLKLRDARLETRPSMRFVLVWETDASDVDLHVYDGSGEHAYFDHPNLKSGGALTGDVTTGYGPEGFVINGKETALAFPYQLRVHYFARGSMGFGMGKVQIVRHDGAGKLDFEDRPFVLMKQDATLDLGEVKERGSK